VKTKRINHVTLKVKGTKGTVQARSYGYGFITAAGKFIPRAEAKVLKAVTEEFQICKK
jgi:hypothetical protein